MLRQCLLSDCTGDGKSSAWAGFFVGDFFLARYAANFFAKSLLPRCTARCVTEKIQHTSGAFDRRRICMYCWLHCDTLVIENVCHMFANCPMNSKARDSMLPKLSAGVQECLASLSTEPGLHNVFSASNPSDIEVISEFLSCVRHCRRKFKKYCNRLENQLKRDAFSARKVAWRARGLNVCRHGMFFKKGFYMILYGFT